MITDLLLLRTTRQFFARLLLYWSVGSIVVGGAMIALAHFNPAASWHVSVGAMGWQHLIWGAIDLCFAIPGILYCRRTAAIAPTDDAAAIEFADREKLAAALGFNNRLNIIWLAGGVGLLIWALIAEGESRQALLGHALGVLPQAAFLFLSDRAFSKAIRPAGLPAVNV